MPDIPTEAYEAAAVALASVYVGHPRFSDRDRTEATEGEDWCRECAGLDVASLRASRIVLDAVWPLAYASGVAEGRRQAAEAIRAGIVPGPVPKWAVSGRAPKASDLAEWAARIAEGKEDTGD